MNNKWTVFRVGPIEHDEQKSKLFAKRCESCENLFTYWVQGVWKEHKCKKNTGMHCLSWHTCPNIDKWIIEEGDIEK